MVERARFRGPAAFRAPGVDTTAGRRAEALANVLGAFSGIASGIAQQRTRQIEAAESLADQATKTAIEDQIDLAAGLNPDDVDAFLQATNTGVSKDVAQPLIEGAAIRGCGKSKRNRPDGEPSAVPNAKGSH